MQQGDSVYYKNVYYDRWKNKVFVQEVVNGVENHFSEDFDRIVYVPDPQGTHKDIYGNLVKPMKVEYDQLNNLRKMYGSKLCESDISEEVQYITKRYGGMGEMKPDMDSFNVASMDIEVESPDEFPKPELAKYPINLISCHSSKTGKMTTFGIRPYTGTRTDFDYHYYADEKEMLVAFIKYFRKQKFNIITGWSVKKFDIQYIINRCTNLEIDYQKLSPYNTITSRLGKIVQGRQNYHVTIAGISILDYLELYDNFTFDTKESYTLNFIGSIEVGEGKLDLEGQVNNEWRTNWNNFVEYNVQDVLLVNKIDAKKKFLNLSILMAHESLITFDKVLSSVAVIEGLISRDNRDNNVVMPDRSHTHYDRWKHQKLYESGRGYPNGIENDPVNDDDEEEVLENGMFKDFYIKGGHVEAYPGWYKSVLSFDVESEYPHMIMAYNISPETKVFNPSKEIIKRDNLIKSAINGIYFKREQGILPRITHKIFMERRHFKKLKETAQTNGDKPMVAYYDSMQHIRKIQVNSIYGVMGSKYFHFYDVDCARAVTRGGRQMIRYLAKGFDDYFKNHFHLEFNKLFPERQLTNPPKLSDKVVCLIDTDSVVGDTLVTSNYGKMRIDKMYETVVEYNYSIDGESHEKCNGEDSYILSLGRWIYPTRPFTVETVHPKTGKIVKGVVSYFKKHKVRKNMWKITAIDLSYGIHRPRSVIMTEDHGIITRFEYYYETKKPSEIVPGDTIYCNGKWHTEYTVECLGEMEEWVYDIEVLDYHTFIGNGFLLHNSNYLTVDEIVKKYFPDKTFAEIAIEIEERIMNPLIAKLLKVYWDYQSLENIINFKREGIILDMIILAKKKYIKHIIQNEKEVYNPPKTKYTGVEVVRSDVPRFTRDQLDSFYKNLFNYNRDEKKELRQRCLEKIWETKKVFKDLNIEKISFNSSVKEYTKYAQPVEHYISEGLSYPPHCPVHTRASINYNFLIKKLSLPYQPVGNGSKVKYGYVKSKNKKLINQDVVAYIGNYPEEFKKIFELDWKKQFENSYLSPIQKLFDVLDLGSANENEKLGNFFEE